MTMATPIMTEAAGCIGLLTIDRPMKAYTAVLPKMTQAMTDSGRTTTATGIPTTVMQRRMKSTGSPTIARNPVRKVMPGRCASVSPHFLTPPGKIRARRM